MKYGYVRVSTTDQNAQLQIDAMNDAGITEIFSDTMSGSTKNRPALDELREKLQPGDTVVVWKMDRIFRSMTHTVNQLSEWTERGIWFKCLTQPIDTSDTSPTGKLLAMILMAFGEFERDMIRERTNAGLAAAVASGKKLGKPRLLNTQRIEHVKREIANGASVQSMADFHKVSRQTIWRELKRREA